MINFTWWEGRIFLGISKSTDASILPSIRYISWLIHFYLCLCSSDSKHGVIPQLTRDHVRLILTQWRCKPKVGVEWTKRTCFGSFYTHLPNKDIFKMWKFSTFCPPPIGECKTNTWREKIHETRISFEIKATLRCWDIYLESEDPFTSIEASLWRWGWNSLFVILYFSLKLT